MKSKKSRTKQTTGKNGAKPAKSKATARKATARPSYPVPKLITPNPLPSARHIAKNSPTCPHSAHAVIVRSSIEHLQSAALRGDALAMVTLVDVARNATRAVHAIFDNDPPKPKHPRWTPPRTLDEIDRPVSPPPVFTKAERLEAVRYFVGSGQPFPSLHHFHKSGGREETTQAEILHALQHGPLSGQHNEHTEAAFLWSEAYEAIQEIGRSIEEPAEGWRKRAYDLTALTHETASEWVHVATDYIAERWAHLLQEPGSPLHCFALIEFQNARRKATNALHARWADEEKRLAALDRRNGKRPEKRGGYIPPVDFDAINSMRPTVNSLKQGIRTRLTLFLRNLHT